jgi:shikimate kinase
MEKALHGGGSPAPDSICVVGFMGGGESTVGPAVAARLSMPHVDVDTRIRGEDRPHHHGDLQESGRRYSGGTRRTR